MRAAMLSWGYRATRKFVIRQTYKGQEKRGLLPDLEEVVQLGDKALKKLNRYAGWLAFQFSIPEGIGYDLYDLHFPSPLTFASFKEESDILAIWLGMGLGGGALKTILREPREGNPRPRLQEAVVDGQEAIINAMGLPGKGVLGLIEELDSSSLFRFNRPIGISIGGYSVEEYKWNFLDLNTVLSNDGEKKYYIELNISCPNTPSGQDLMKHPDQLEDLLTWMRQNTDRVIGVKVSPDKPDATLLAIAEIVRQVPKTFINAGNTQFRTCEQLGLPKPYISIGGGGMSGAPLFARTLEMTALLAPLKIPIMATGGISTCDQVRALQSKGAVLFGMATALVKDPYCVPKINSQLKK